MVYYETRAKKLPTFLNPREQERLLLQPNRRYPTGERNLLILVTLLDTGIRISELSGIKWIDVNLNSGRIMIHGKGGKDRSVWWNSEDLELARKWRARQGEEIGRCDFVFTTLKGKKISSRYLQYMVKRYCKKAEIDKDISPHKLRHTFACDFLEGGGNVYELQRLLGHSRISTTQIYCHVQDGRLESAMKGFRQNRGLL